MFKMKPSKVKISFSIAAVCSAFIFLFVFRSIPVITSGDFYQPFTDRDASVFLYTYPEIVAIPRNNRDTPGKKPQATQTLWLSAKRGIRALSPMANLDLS